MSAADVSTLHALIAEALADHPAFPGQAARLPLATEVACLGALLARADHTVDETEWEALEGLLTRYFALDASLARRLLRRLLAPGTPLPGQAALTAAVKARGVVDRLLLVDALLEIAAADGHLAPAEERFARDVGSALGVPEAALAGLIRRRDPGRAGDVRVVPIGPREFTLGRDAACGVRLDDPDLAPVQLRLRGVSGAIQLDDVTRSAALTIGGQPTDRCAVAPGAVARLGRWAFSPDETASALRIWDAERFLAISVEDLTVTLPATWRSGPMTLLRGVSLSAFSGQVIAVLGPSGAGKTTFIQALLGLTPATGRVRINGEAVGDLVADRRSRVGLVPQDNLVYASLTVRESLRFTAQLRAAEGATARELDRRVLATEAALGLTPIAHRRVGDAVDRGISGGERKRVNIGQELVDPATRVLMLDEPTTGLDPHTSLEIMRLIRGLADDGRIVFVVTHDASPEMLQHADLALVLGRGGHPVYVGPPAEILPHTGAPSMPALYARLLDEIAAEADAIAFRASPSMHRHVLLPRRLQGDLGTHQAAPRVAPSAARLRRGLGQIVRQTGPMIHRFALVRWRDRAAWAMALAQVPLIVAACAMVFGSTLVEQGEPVIPGSLPFVMVLASFWFGAVNGVRELVSDLAVFRRERLAGVLLLPYMTSKLLVLGALTAAQTLALTACCELAFGLSARQVDLAGVAAATTATGLCGLVTGLAASAVARSPAAAISSLPALVMPQLLFGGVLVPFTRLAAPIEALSALAAARWGMAALVLAGAPGSAPEGGFVLDGCSRFTLPGLGRPCRDWYLAELGLGLSTPTGEVVLRHSASESLLALGLLTGLLAATAALLADRR